MVVREINEASPLSWKALSPVKWRADNQAPVYGGLLASWHAHQAENRIAARLFAPISAYLLLKARSNAGALYQ